MVVDLDVIAQDISIEILGASKQRAMGVSLERQSSKKCKTPSLFCRLTPPNGATQAEETSCAR